MRKVLLLITNSWIEFSLAKWLLNKVTCLSVFLIKFIMLNIYLLTINRISCRFESKFFISEKVISGNIWWASFAAINLETGSEDASLADAWASGIEYSPKAIIRWWRETSTLRQHCLAHIQLWVKLFYPPASNVEYHHEKLEAFLVFTSGQGKCYSLNLAAKMSTKLGIHLCVYFSFLLHHLSSSDFSSCFMSAQNSHICKQNTFITCPQAMCALFEFK